MLVLLFAIFLKMAPSADMYLLRCSVSYGKQFFRCISPKKREHIKDIELPEAERRSMKNDKHPFPWSLCMCAAS